jgi:predicted nucleic acid-binding protein
MFVLDTNVVSELRKVKSGKADMNVAAWSATVLPSTLFLSAITILELETGVLLLERRDSRAGAVLREWLDGHVLPAFAGRILAFDEVIAKRCAVLHIPDHRGQRDSVIAATALVHRMTVVTRNVKDFESTGVAIVNPWESA